MRRVWIGLYIAGFAIFGGIALTYNLVQGLALCALALVIVAMAFVYNRALLKR